MKGVKNLIHRGNFDLYRNKYTPSAENDRGSKNNQLYDCTGFINIEESLIAILSI